VDNFYFQRVSVCQEWVFFVLGDEAMEEAYGFFFVLGDEAM
jgi:hypothetical protein